MSILSKFFRLESFSYGTFWLLNYLFLRNNYNVIPNLRCPEPAEGFRDLYPMKVGFVYILTNKPRGTLYIGVTSGIEN